MDHNAQAVMVFNNRASEYQAKYMDVSLYHDTFDTFCKAISEKQPKVLELACGPGNITRYLLLKRPDLDLLATDLALNMLDLARNNNPQARFAVLDCREIAKLPGRYDAIMCGFCLPYLTREEAIQLIADAAGILKPGGILYLSTMEDRYSNSQLVTGTTGDQLFIHYHESGYLATALVDHKFTILSIERKSYPAADGTPTTDLIIIAQKEG